MRQLSKLQIDLIRGDIRQSGVEMRDLEDDLLDHVCCAIEMESTQRSFEDLYAEIKKTIFPNGYRKIQHETTHLLTLKYKKMKKTMNTLGIIGSVMLMVGSIMKTLHLMGANELLFFGGIILVFGYLPFMLALSMKGTDSIFGKIRNISGYLGAASIVAGVVLNVLHLYPAKTLMLTGMGLLIIVFLPLFLKSVSKDLIMKIHPITSAVIILAFVSTLFAFNNKLPSNGYKSSLAELNNNASQAFEYRYERLKELRNVHPEDKELSQASEEVIDYIRELKKQFLDVYNIESENLELLGYDQILNFDKHEEFTLNANENYTYTGKELQEKVVAFHNLLKEKHPEIQTPIIQTEKDPLSDKDRNRTWLETHFLHTPMVSAYTYLSQLQLEVVDLEMEVLQK